MTSLGLTCILHWVVWLTHVIYFVIRLDYCAGIFRSFGLYEDFTHGRIWDDRFRTVPAFLVQFYVKALPKEGSFLYIEENSHWSDNLWTCHDCYFLLLECTYAGYVQFCYHNIYHVVSFFEHVLRGNVLELNEAILKPKRLEQTTRAIIWLYYCVCFFWILKFILSFLKLYKILINLQFYNVAVHCWGPVAYFFSKYSMLCNFGLPSTI